MIMPPPSTQSVVGLKDGDPVYWEPGRLRLKLHHTFSKQALAVSELLCAISALLVASFESL